MYVGRDFDASNPGEEEVYALDFVNDIPAGDTLASATWTCEVVSLADGGGAVVDSGASARISGAAQVSGTRTLQKVIGGVAGVRYRLKALAVTSAGDKTILWSHSWCLDPS